MGGSTVEDAGSLLQPWARLWSREIARMHVASDGDLSALLSAAARMTTTNCSWDTYAVAQIMTAEIGRELKYRAYRASLAESRRAQIMPCNHNREGPEVGNG